MGQTKPGATYTNGNEHDQVERAHCAGAHHGDARASCALAGQLVFAGGGQLVAAALWFGLLRLLPHADGSYVEAFAAGAVLTTLANSMIPEAVRGGRRWTGLLVALGFAVAAVLTLLE